MQLKKNAIRMIGKIVNGVTSSVSQTSVKGKHETFHEIERLSGLCRAAAEESIVLLKNNNGTLPFRENDRISVFGRVQFDPFFVGYGSGGDVNAHYKISFFDGMKNAGISMNPEITELYLSWRRSNPVDDGFWGHWPMSYEDMALTPAVVSRAANNSDCALYFLGRSAGEDRDNELAEGSYYLTKTEKQNIELLAHSFPRFAVIMNIGGIMDMEWIEKLHIPCALICWQGGMEAGSALTDVLTGKRTPSGKLTDTIARKYEDYPSAANYGNKLKNRYEEDIFVGYRYFSTFAPQAVLFPFGFGLSYTSFTYAVNGFEKKQDCIEITVTIKNTGQFPGKETVQVYYSCSDKKLGIPSRQLIGFMKTDLLQPNESAELQITINQERLSVFDDSGYTGFHNAYVIPKGDYRIYLGGDSVSLYEAGHFQIDRSICIKQTKSVLAPKKDEKLMVLRPVHDGDRIYKSYKPAVPNDTTLKERILSSLQDEIVTEATSPVTLWDVAEDHTKTDDFIAQLTDTELEAITRGDYIMNSPLGPKGNAGVFGGVLESLREKGLAPVTTTDGPSGIRLAADSALLPCGTALASTWNPQLVSELYAALGEEMADRRSDVLLAPGMNIHRNPLCGRNFEYFSEDPLISGLFGAAVIDGLKKAGVNGCPKHFACNNQEKNRTNNDSVLSERALREIYLRGFEYCVKLASPSVIMTSYNKINGVWGHYNYPLVQEILRGEWGYQGVVITDWWMQSSASPEFPALHDQAYRVRAGVDVLMPGGARVGKKEPDGSLLETLGKPGGITRAELQAAAKHVIQFALDANKIISKDQESEKNESDEL